jgi:4-hydroxy-2-oxoheptanedioate aldolase
MSGAEPRVTRMLTAEEPVIGAWLSLGSPAAAEILGGAGFDWLLVDQQHSAVGPEMLLAMIRAINVTGCSPVVRVLRNEPAWINQALDSGAHGVMVPMVSDRRAAEEASMSARYPPLGQRSIGGYRAQYSFGMSRADYLAKSSEFVQVWVQIEDRLAVRNAEAIASVPGVTGLFVGPQDLAASLGLEPVLEPTAPAFQDALDHLLDVSVRSRRPLGILVPDRESAGRRLREGFRIVAISGDARILADSGPKLIPR